MRRLVLPVALAAVVVAVVAVAVSAFIASGPSGVTPLAGAPGPTSPAGHDLVVLQECLGSQSDGVGFMDPVPGVVGLLLGEVTRSGDPRADLPVVVAFGDDLNQARDRLRFGVNEAKGAFAVAEVTVHGEEGTVAWAAVGPAAIYDPNIESDQQPEQVQARLDRRAEDVMVQCLKASRDAASRSPSVASWVVKDLGTLGGDSSQANAINERGQVVGMSVTAKGTQHAFLWENGRMTDLGTLVGDFTATYANAINSRGQIVGTSEKMVPMGNTEGTVRSLSFLWQGGRMNDLGGLGGKITWARTINDKGQVIGSSTVNSTPGVGHSFLWQNDKMTDLHPFVAAALNESGEIAGTRRRIARGAVAKWSEHRPRYAAEPRRRDSGETSEAVDINAKGQVVGTSNPTGGPDYGHAFVWENGRMIDLGTLGGKSSQARAINERGQVIGYSTTTTDGGWSTRHAFLWENGRMIDLGTLGGKSSEAVAINDRGHVVGHSETASGGLHAFVWENGTMTDLGALPGGVYRAVAAINNHNQIVGTSGTKNGHTHAVLWTPRRDT